MSCQTAACWQTQRQLYFASVDIHRCYDNIDQDHLLSIVGGVLSEEDYLIQRYSVVHPFASMGRVFKSHKKKVGPPETFQPFHRTTSGELTSQHYQSVFIDNSATGANNMAKKNILTKWKQKNTL